MKSYENGKSGEGEALRALVEQLGLTAQRLEGYPKAGQSTALGIKKRRAV